MLVFECKADLHARDKDNDTPLHEATLNGHTNVVKCFLGRFECSPTVKGFEGRSILHCASMTGYVELVEILLTQYNLDPLPVDDNGSTPLHHAALGGREEVAKLLTTKYKCPIDCVNNRQQTPLHYACRKGHLNLVRMLLTEYKADLNAQDKDKNTPLHITAVNCHSNVVKCLLDEFQCSPSLKGFHGRNILHQSCIQDNDSFTKELIDRFNLSLVSTDNDGNTPLHIAVINGSRKSLNLVLNNYQAPVFLRNKAGKSAVDVAKDVQVKKAIQLHLVSQHSKILFDYKKVQTLSTKKYRGAHKLTRIFVVGNIESGKSTLIESLKREGLFSFLNHVSEATVPPHTSGIIPSVHYSKTIGRIVYYDFAGDPEYYSSHSAIVSNVMQAKSGTNIFLVVVNLTKDVTTIRQELGYWFSFVYHIKCQSMKCKLLVIGSHADRIVKAEKTTKLLSICQFMLMYVFDASKLSFDVVDVNSKLSPATIIKRHKERNFKNY